MIICESELNYYTLYIKLDNVSLLTLLHEKFLQFDWLRAVAFQLNLNKEDYFRRLSSVIRQ